MGFTVAAAIGASAADGSFTYPGCTAVSKSDFNVVTMMNKANTPGLEEPVRFSVAKDGKVYFGERNGTVRVIDPSNGSITKIGQVPVQDIHSALTKGGNNEFGLDGLMLDRNFAANNWIWIYYQDKTQLISKLSRFKVNGTTLDLSSEQIVLQWAYQRDYCCHTGGGMDMDNKGDLWLGIGNNTRNPGTEANGYVNDVDAASDGRSTSLNTNDLRGKVIRIHPLDTKGADGNYYSIPAGNLKEAFASMWSASDLTKVRPEIYTMGHRSDWSVAVDTATGIMTEGDIGPDDGWDTEEYNLVTKPANLGFPEFCGAEGNAHYQYRLSQDPKAPINDSKWNTGVTNLPPAVGAFIGYRQAAAVTGPIYRWQPWQTSAKKLPPHFMDKWFISDFDAGYLDVVTLDNPPTKVVNRTTLMSGLVRPVQITIGPDGMLYTLEYAVNFFSTDGSTALKRYEFKGAACTVGIETNIAASHPHGQSALVSIGAGLARSLTLPAHAAGVKLYDMRGKLAWEYAAAGRGTMDRKLDVPDKVGNGLYRSKIEY